MRCGVATSLAIGLPLQSGGDAVGNLGRPTQDVCFPKAQNNPVGRREGRRVPAIALDISLHLLDPVSRVVPSCEFRKACLEVPAVPEIAVAEDEELVLGEDDVGSTRETGSVQAIAETAPPQLTTENKLAASVGFRARSARGRGGFLGCWAESLE